MNKAKRIGWKVLVGPTSSFISGITDPSTAIDVRIQEYLKDGWVLKGPMLRAHPTSSVWTQIIEKYETK
jgi:hypothetical protein